MKITFVKKILADGSACKKCGDVIRYLEEGDQMQYIDQTLIADERDPRSEGMLLAEELGVERAPFFVVEKENGEKEVYTIYFKFVKEVLKQQFQAKDEDKEILEQNSDLDFL